MTAYHDGFAAAAAETRTALAGRGTRLAIPGMPREAGARREFLAGAAAAVCHVLDSTEPENTGERESRS
jgi:hypothetical protein